MMQSASIAEQRNTPDTPIRASHESGSTHIAVGLLTSTTGRWPDDSSGLYRACADRLAHATLTSDQLDRLLRPIDALVARAMTEPVEMTLGGRDAAVVEALLSRVEHPAVHRTLRQLVDSEVLVPRGLAVVIRERLETVDPPPLEEMFERLGVPRFNQSLAVEILSANHEGRERLLTALLEGSRGADRWAGTIRSLTETEESRLLGRLSELLSDRAEPGSEQVRRAGVLITVLACSRSPLAAEALVEIVLDERHAPELRERAAEGVGRTGDPVLIAWAGERLDGGETVDGCIARTLLLGSADPRAERLLAGEARHPIERDRKLLTDRLDAEWAKTYGRFLARTGHPEDVAFLERVLRTPDVDTSAKIELFLAVPDELRERFVHVLREEVSRGPHHAWPVELRDAYTPSQRSARMGQAVVTIDEYLARSQDRSFRSFGSDYGAADAVRQLQDVRSDEVKTRMTELAMTAPHPAVRQAAIRWL